MNRVRIVLLLVTGVCWSVAPAGAQAADAALPREGFSEPYRTYRLAAADLGVIGEILVHEGERVKAGQAVAELDQSVHLVLAQIAKTGMNSKAEVEAAEIDRELKRRRLEKLTNIHEAGHATVEEFWRAQTEYRLADALVRSAQERQLLRRLEFDKITAQIENRRIRAPIDGVVTVVHKRNGELVGPTDPVVCEVARLDKLLITMHLRRTLLTNIREGSTQRVMFLDSQREAAAIVEYVAPVADAESGTVTVKLRVENADGKLPAGERCRWLEDQSALNPVETLGIRATDLRGVRATPLR